MTKDTPPKPASDQEHSTSSPNQNRYQQLFHHLAQFGQEHVFGFWDELNDAQRNELIEQLTQLDLHSIEQLFQNSDNAPSIPTDPNSFGEPDGFALNDPRPRFTRDEAIAAGETVLRDGAVGVVLVAGGQGTRLGFSHPKGMYPIGPLSAATLFEILLTKVQAVAKRYGTSVPVYIMTSPATYDETVEFLEENKRFGFLADDLFVFCQGTMPAVDIETGKLLLSTKHSLSLSPDGHGGMLSALDHTGAFEHMCARGIKQLFYMQIDNPLVDVAAVDAIGYHVLSNAGATTMVIRKYDPLEKVGNVAVVDGKTQIVEYSDLPDEVAQLRREDGSLVLWAGNVAVHVWDVSFLRDTAATDTGLPFHYAHKKIPYVDEQGNTIQPAEPNGLKFERFIFDLLPSAQQAILVEVDRKEYFAPLKNPSGAPTDSPEAVRSQMTALHRAWLEAAGVFVAEGITVEIQPSFASTAEEVANKVDSTTRFVQDYILK